MDLSISEETDDAHRRVLRLVGALDLASRDLLLDAAAKALAASRPTTGLVLDLAGVSFFDSSGVGAVVQVARDAEDADAAFALQAPSQRVTRVLEVSGLLDAWPIEDAPV